jgi:hypothetical protein
MIIYAMPKCNSDDGRSTMMKIYVITINDHEHVWKCHDYPFLQPPVIDKTIGNLEIMN